MKTGLRGGVLKIGLIFMSIALIFSFGAPAIFAEEGEKESKAKTDMTFQSGRDVLKFFSKVLSGSAWLRAEGFGPGSIDFGPGDGSTLQAPGAMGLVPYRSPAPAFSRNYLISRDLGAPIQTESHIAVNPKDPNHLVVATIDYGLPYNPVYTSFDAGVTWQGPNRVPLSDDTNFAGDPVVAFNRQGSVYQVFMSIGEKSYDLGPFFIDFEISDIVIASSKDGLVWQKPTVAGTSVVKGEIQVDRSGRATGSIIFTFPDKPWIDIGPDPVNPAKDIIYVTYTEFSYFTQIVYAGELPFLRLYKMEAAIILASSKDQGKTWSKPKELARRTLFGLGQKPGEEIKLWVVQGSQPKVAKDGTLHVAWYDSTEDGADRGKAVIYLVSSRDAGQTFTKPVVAAESLEIERFPSTVFFRNASRSPQMAVSGDQEVYIVFSGKSKEKPTDDGDIYFVRSLDAGKSFSAPTRINGDRTDRLQFFPSIAADPKGNLHVMWGDMRDDTAGLKYHIYYTQSLDKGKTWGFELPERGIREPDTRVTDFPSNPNKGFRRGLFIGDYFSIAASEKDVYLVWADTRLGEYGPINQKVGFARRKAISSPEVFLNPASGPGGQEVIVQAHNFQPDLNIFIRIGGSIVSAGRSDQDGRLTYRLFVPVASEGTHDIVVFDESGNTTVGSFYMDFGFGNIASSIEEGEVRVLGLNYPELKETLDALRNENKAMEEKIGLIKLILVVLGIVFTGAVVLQIVLSRKRR